MSNNAKYFKLRTHDSEDEKKKYISKHIQNETFLGEDSIRGAKEVIITEGIPDVISAIDKGFAAISPATTSFRDADYKKLEELTKDMDAIYIINDNDKNKAGYEGALKTGKRLAMAGRNVFLVELPRPEGAEKIDLNEYLKDHSAEDLKKLMKQSKSIIEILIDELPKIFPKAQPKMQSEILPLLEKMNGGVLEYYCNKIKERTGVTKKVIIEEIEDFRNKQRSECDEKQDEPVDPEIKNMAQEIAKDPMQLKSVSI